MPRNQKHIRELRFVWLDSLESVPDGEVEHYLNTTVNQLPSSWANILSKAREVRMLLMRAHPGQDTLCFCRSGGRLLGGRGCLEEAYRGTIGRRTLGPGPGSGASLLDRWAVAP